MILLAIIFWTGLFLIAYTYLIFPVLLRILSHGKKDECPPANDDELPFLTVLIPAYNEEVVLERKLNSVLGADYPKQRLEILVGNDASTDRTAAILNQMCQKHPLIRVRHFKARTGKPTMINELVKDARGELLVITDANVMIDPDALREMAFCFREPAVGLVDSQMINPDQASEKLMPQEQIYNNREVRIKHREGLLWGTMMGPFGGCYALRKSLYSPVPDNFLVDDFFINMRVLEEGYRSISRLPARVYEEIRHNEQEEFLRKKRISAGNFQNLVRFRRLLLSKRSGLAFCFFSHKVVRWCVPFLMLLTFLSSAILALHSSLYALLAFLQLCLFLLPLIDHFTRKIKCQVLPLRLVSHFVLMNLALLAGYFKYLGGINNNVWQPTKRQ